MSITKKFEENSCTSQFCQHIRSSSFWIWFSEMSSYASIFKELIHLVYSEGKSTTNGVKFSLKTSSFVAKSRRSSLHENHGLGICKESNYLLSKQNEVKTNRLLVSSTHTSNYVPHSQFIFHLHLLCILFRFVLKSFKQP